MSEPVSEPIVEISTTPAAVAAAAPTPAKPKATRKRKAREPGTLVIANVARYIVDVSNEVARGHPVARLAAEKLAEKETAAAIAAGKTDVKIKPRTRLMSVSKDVLDSGQRRIIHDVAAVTKVANSLREHRDGGFLSRKDVQLALWFIDHGLYDAPVVPIKTRAQPDPVMNEKMALKTFEKINELNTERRKKAKIRAELREAKSLNGDATTIASEMGGDEADEDAMDGVELTVGEELAVETG